MPADRVLTVDYSHALQGRNPVSENSTKVTATHLRRDAYLYVRQSTLYQVANNTESGRRQYDLRGRATALGWPAERVIVIDVDQGQSGASSADREGFKRPWVKPGSCSAWNAPDSPATTPTGIGCCNCAPSTPR
jgi:type IV pilus biogenesis protein CpaD/CtpE